MGESIGQYVRRRVRFTAVILAGGIATLAYLVDHRSEPWAATAALVVFGAMAAGLIWSGSVKCPRCGGLFSRDDFARFAWPFLSEPDSCPECGISLDAPKESEHP